MILNTFLPEWNSVIDMKNSGIKKRVNTIGSLSTLL